MNFIDSARLLGALALLFVAAACHPPAPPGKVGPAPTLAERMAVRLGATGTYRDVEAVVLAERRRGESGRARVLFQALWQRRDIGWRDEFLGRLADTARPERAPYIERQLGLESYPPLLYSSAAPLPLRRVAEALSGQGLVPALLEEANQFREAAEYIEAAGVLTLVQLMLPGEPGQRVLRPVLSRAWQRLARQRRCVAQLFDAAQPEGRLLPSDLPDGLPADQAVAAFLATDPDRLPCAVIAAQLTTTEPRLSASADWAARALLAPVVISARFASLSLVQTTAAAPQPVLRRDGQTVRGALLRGMAMALAAAPAETRRLLPLLGREQRGALHRERREELALRVLFHAPPSTEVGEKLQWAYDRHLSVVSADPERYLTYLSRLGEPLLGGVVLALREPDGRVLSQVISLLSAYPPETVRDALSVEPGEPSSFGAQERHNRELMRALFRLPPEAARGVERRQAQETALDLHRCCRGDEGTCQRLHIPPPKLCPVWTPLLWY